MTTASIITFWIDNDEGGHDMDVTRLLGSGDTSFVGQSAQDVPVDNPVICLLETDDAGVIADIENDPLYGNPAILWSTNPKPPNDVPSAAEFGLLRAHLAQPPISMSQAQITEAIGILPKGRPRIEIDSEFQEWINQR